MNRSVVLVHSLRHYGMMMVWHNKTTVCLYLVSRTFYSPIFITQTEIPWSQTSTCSQTPLKVVPTCTTSVGGGTYHSIISYHSIPSCNIGLSILRCRYEIERVWKSTFLHPQDMKLLPRSTDFSMANEAVVQQELHCFFQEHNSIYCNRLESRSKSIHFGRKALVKPMQVLFEGFIKDIFISVTFRCRRDRRDILCAEISLYLRLSETMCTAPWRRLSWYQRV